MRAQATGPNRTVAHLDEIDPPVPRIFNDSCRRLPSSVIVYGNLHDAGANHYAAEQLQHSFLNGYESEVPIYKDFAASDELLRQRDVVFVGRREANSALALWSARLGLDYTGASFTINGEVQAKRISPARLFRVVTLSQIAELLAN
jgi:hypothetical protein